LKYIIYLSLLFTSLLATDSPYQQGKALYFSKGCNGCHGVKAEGMTTYPFLANRAKGFLTYKLNTYRKKEVSTQTAWLMVPFAETLNDDEIDKLTTFLNEFKDDQTERYDIEFQSEGDGGS